MKKFLGAILTITLLSVTYVSQHTQLLEYSYRISDCKKSLSLLIDQNQALRYNIAKLEAPARLEEAIVAVESVEKICMPAATYKINIKELRSPYKEVTPAGVFANAGRAILGMFSFTSEAVANELK